MNRPWSAMRSAYDTAVPSFHVVPRTLSHTVTA